MTGELCGVNPERQFARRLLPAFLACLCVTVGGLANAQKMTTVNGCARAENQDEITDKKSFWVSKNTVSGLSGDMALKCDEFR